MGSKKIIIGSWPGKDFKDNDFIQIYIDSLVNAGFDVVSLNYLFLRNFPKLNILNIHWPEIVFWKDQNVIRQFLYCIKTIFLLHILKMRGVKIVWMAHNVAPHDKGSRVREFVSTWYMICIRRLLDGVVTLSPNTIPVVRRLGGYRPLVKFGFARHPVYESRGPALDRDIAKQKVGVPLDVKHVVFFGQIRPYKGIQSLIDNFDSLGGSYYLTVCGECKDNDLNRKLMDFSEKELFFSYLGRRLNDVELDTIVASSDIVVLPFVSSLHSGSMMHALSKFRQVLTKATPFSMDVSSCVGGNWVVHLDSSFSMDALRAVDVPSTAQPNLKEFSFHTFSRSLSDFYVSIVQ